MSVNTTKLWNCSKRKVILKNQQHTNCLGIICEKQTAEGRSKALRSAAALMAGVCSWQPKRGEVLTDGDSQRERKNESGRISETMGRNKGGSSSTQGAAHTLCKHEEIGSPTEDPISLAAHLTNSWPRIVGVCPPAPHTHTHTHTFSSYQHLDECAEYKVRPNDPQH